MALLLNIETATGVCSVSVSLNGLPVAVRETDEAKAHASKLTLLIQECMAASATSIQMLDAVAVSMGPGSYTGLRIGLATAKGICFAADKPLIGVSTLEAMAAYWFHMHAHRTDELACPMIDARRMEVYAAVFNHDMQPLKPVQALVVESGVFGKVLEQHRVCFFGDGMDKCREHIGESNNAFFDHQTKASSIGVGICADKLFTHQRFEDLARAVPLYLKEFKTTSQKKGMS